MQTHFDNGWGVSVIDFGRGSADGLLELAVLKDGELHYENPVAKGDTRGWLTDEVVGILITEVASWSEDQTFPDWEEE